MRPTAEASLASPKATTVTYVIMLLFIALMVVMVLNVALDVDGIYGSVPQRLIDEEDEKLRLWKSDTDIVSVWQHYLQLSLFPATSVGYEC